MIETIMLIVVIFVLSGVFWYSFFYQKEKKAFEPAAANAGLCNRWRIGTDRSIRRKVFCS
mgnify:CR=1 FL=1